MLSVSVQNVKKYYRDQKRTTEALKEISLEIKSDEFVSVIGPNGSGKSTLFSLLLGIIKPDSGKIILEPNNCRLGFVFQNYRDSLMPWATVLENLLLPLEESHLTLQEKQKFARELLVKFGLEKFEDSYVHEISGGMSQLVSLARSLIVNPEFLLLDEPFSALDYQRSVKMQEMLADFWEEKKMTTFMISHDIDDAIYLSDKIIVLSGRPGAIKEVIHNTLPRPRNFKVRLSDDFDTLREKLLRIIESNEIAL